MARESAPFDLNHVQPLPHCRNHAGTPVSRKATARTGRAAGGFDDGKRTDLKPLFMVIVSSQKSNLFPQNFYFILITRR